MTSLTDPIGLESFPCYAKINLFLEIQDKRSDGYHNLGSLFQTLAIADRLKAEPWDTVALVGAENITANPEENLIYKAARLLQKTYPDRILDQAGIARDKNGNAGIRFHLEKNLPAGAGLGGGSSDAATALILTNHIWKLNLSVTDMLPMAAQLGADVPFFLHGGTAFGEGKGETLSPAPEPFPFHIVVATPRCTVDTAWAYGQLPKKDPSKKYSWASFKALYFTYCEDEKFYQVLRNDFDLPMREKLEPIQTLFTAMQAFSPIKTMLSGSGASLFSLFVEKADAEACLASVQDQCRYSALTQFMQ